MTSVMWRFLASDGSRYMTGATVNVDGGALAGRNTDYRGVVRLVFSEVELRILSLSPWRLRALVGIQSSKR